MEVRIVEDAASFEEDLGSWRIGDQPALTERPEWRDALCEVRASSSLGGTSGASTAFFDTTLKQLELSRAGRWEKYDGRSGEWVNADPPDKVSKTLLEADGYWGYLRELIIASEVPVITSTLPVGRTLTVAASQPPAP